MKSLVLISILVLPSFLSAQSISGGTVVGTVRDPSQMLVPGAQAELSNPVSGYKQTVTADATGVFRFNNVPPNMYDIVITAPGFTNLTEPLEVRGSVPVSITYTLKMGQVSTTLEVTANSSLIDTDPVAHTDADSSAFMKLPRFDPASGLSSALIITPRFATGVNDERLPSAPPAGTATSSSSSISVCISFTGRCGGPA